VAAPVAAPAGPTESTESEAARRAGDGSPSAASEQHTPPAKSTRKVRHGHVLRPGIDCQDDEDPIARSKGLPHYPPETPED
jgi:hypothetical protein